MRKYLKAVDQALANLLLGIFAVLLIVLIGIAYQLHRIERKIQWMWEFLKGPDT